MDPILELQVFGQVTFIEPFTQNTKILFLLWPLQVFNKNTWQTLTNLFQMFFLDVSDGYTKSAYN